MKKHLALAIIFLLSISLQAQISHIELNDNWTFRQVRTDIWHKATVPGLVHTDLIDNGLIEDPFFRLNERGVQWIDKEDWEYKTIFSADEDIFAKQNIEMVFYGLDIYADVYLNDSLILKADNMFRSWRIDIKKLLKKENNELRVYFHSPIKVDIPKFDAVGFKYATDNDQSANGGIFDKQIGVFARKAGYHYGWDWGPRLVTIGIWRPIAIEAWNSVKINNIWYRQDNISSKNANITAIADIEASTDKDALITIETTEKGQKWQKKVHLAKGNNKIEIPINIKNPHLWWCYGLGEPYLYKFTASVSTNGETDSRCDNIGIRDIKIVREKDQFGTSFYVKLNGEPVFMKGANYIPQHSFLTEVTDSMYEKTILDAVNANMNMLRVWGGGIYENDIFYELCDKYGILVWQDFMFACSLYPTEGELLENIRLEAIENVIHLRNHASIALWCGNNECQA
ncbi:MAG: glycoside hydrolase family 2 protein, partial [Bacteroidales bacterium]|nr:glycoside hydrolase family 2 protein [Bacteroidales bacterium]